MLPYKELIVWQKAFEVALKTYKVTESFPESEKFGLQSQMRRAAVSISSNIAEGSKRGTHKDYISFLKIAEGSAAELETQLLLAKELKYIPAEEYANLELIISEVVRMLPSVVTKLKSTNY